MEYGDAFVVYSFSSVFGFFGESGHEMGAFQVGAVGVRVGLPRWLSTFCVHVLST